MSTEGGIDEYQLVEQILSENANVVLLGETHSAKTEFRKIVLTLLPLLRGKGFEYLALELLPNLTTSFDRYVRGDCPLVDLQEQLREQSISQFECFDELLLEAIKTWCRHGGELLFINSLDPNSDSPEVGREQFMCDTIMSVLPSKVVVLVGEAHTFVRTADERAEHLRQFEEHNRETDEGRAEPFVSAAERLVDEGVSIFSVSEFWSSEASSHIVFPDGLHLRAQLPKQVFTERIVRWAGSKHQIGRELKSQMLSYGPGQVNAIYIENTDPYVAFATEFTEKMGAFKKRRILTNDNPSE